MYTGRPAVSRRPDDLGDDVRFSHLNTHQVHQAARFYAAAEATVHGHTTELLGPRTRLKINGKVAQLFARRQAWQPTGENPIKDDADFVIFVDMATSNLGFYIAPAGWARDDILRRHAEWLSRIGGTRPRNPDSQHRTIEVEHIAQWRDRWDLF